MISARFSLKRRQTVAFLHEVIQLHKFTCNPNVGHWFSSDVICEIFTHLVFIFHDFSVGDVTALGMIFFHTVSMDSLFTAVC